MADAKSVIKMAKDAGAEFIDVKFTGLLGDMQHLTYPVEAQLNEDFFTDGVGFDGSSVRGFQTIDKSDMLLMPDPESAFMDPAYDTPTLSVFANIVDPMTREPYSRDPRYIVRQSRGIYEIHRHRRHRLLWPGSRILPVQWRFFWRPARRQRRRRPLFAL